MDNLQITAPAASFALGHLRESSLDFSTPFAQDVVLVERARIAGTSHQGDAVEVLGKLQVGTQLTLVREPSNRHDPWSIRILDPEGRKLGYIPADINEILARLMDSGRHLYARVCEKDDSDTWTKVYVEVHFDD